MQPPVTGITAIKAMGLAFSGNNSNYKSWGAQPCRSGVPHITAKKSKKAARKRTQASRRKNRGR